MEASNGLSSTTFGGLATGSATSSYIYCNLRQSIIVSKGVKMVGGCIRKMFRGVYHTYHERLDLDRSNDLKDIR